MKNSFKISKCLKTKNVHLQFQLSNQNAEFFSSSITLYLNGLNVSIIIKVKRNQKNTCHPISYTENCLMKIIYFIYSTTFVL